jgi:hypothetical protein
MSNVDSSGAVIVCSHVAVQKLPILYARRDGPIHDVDSGWQVLCNSGELEDEAQAQVWSIDDVVEYEPTLKPWMSNPAPILIIRKSTKDPWKRGAP